MTFTTRFAPSPTGPLHLGHAYSALLAHDLAIQAGGTFLLRIEDIDLSRARPEWEAMIFNDLAWLGLAWPEPVMRQSERIGVYQAVLDDLWARGLLYPCTCSRRDIQSAAAAPQEGAPMFGPDGLIYPGTCRPTEAAANALSRRNRPTDLPLRLNMTRATAAVGEEVGFTEKGQGPEGEAGEIRVTAWQLTHGIGDIVLARRDMGTSYHLSVVVDDAAQAITRVVRGQDLFEATAIHVLLQALLDLPHPDYHHHRLIRDPAGKRLAKRDDARAIARFREDGASPSDIRAMVGL
ncbi:tRNA glutamyl-Q(34) synthetase GluQRS [Sedimentitalea arenosa]|uniref:tRNA glutamyl-Q(34) synthetase GluQRS n=1 Tax=Sedimentitalea arenosa TaxID=2798803 RepID=A0A8J7J4N6_9RHOB|nr:tRNA glutamyl-Q(34) synthetase GluQRS [Arenibacterium arenosum]MBJ6371525.1 tRNA glutamyl-Q(34) synthetase GluQRS [Arenibacterium arenosum]